ncbi:phosphoglycerate mutase family member 5 [Trypanosoma theileri]|uniref:Serine/threonine-protein phosphatase PGAM5, mitochondrial n=1 Tax=Trypanosoma theileri TaxID=67003 RepID=A0A1X0P349_9TRYP|nr:phosphoglycerate mutase family member 5 [Trypanosoma theileri]ORC91376.1 phosphoglycerate mutase family member 5 [Trypanosoma theileri]
MFSRIFFGACLGFGASSFSTVFCDAGKLRGISPDGLINHSLDDLPTPTKEELEYVKTWGVSWVEDWDRPGIRGIRGDRSRSVKRQIILVRHGQYQNEDSKDDRIRTLTPLGEEQSKITGDYLWKAFIQSGIRRDGVESDTMYKSTEVNSESKNSVSIEMNSANHMGGFLVASEPKYVHVSDMTRAQQTAKLILKSFPSRLHKRLATDATLRELFPCDPEPPRKHRHASYKDMKVVEGVFEKYFHRPISDESSVEIIVGHANVIRYLVCRALQLPPEAWLRISLPHCSITSITINGKGHVSLSCLGSAGHLPADMVTTRNLP